MSQKKVRIPGTLSKQPRIVLPDGRTVILGGDPDEIKEKTAEVAAQMAIRRFNSYGLQKRRETASAMMGIPIEKIEDAHVVDSGNNVKLDIKFKEPGS